MKKTINLGINGFGRIGRDAMRIMLNRGNVKIKAVNSRADAQSHAYLLKHDSTYGLFKRNITAGDDYIKINGSKTAVLKENDPGKIPWDKYDIDVVIEATGLFRDKKSASKHLKKGVKQVVISAPAKDDTPTFVYGVNHEKFNPKKDKVISNSSCTTNCLATSIKVLHERFGIKGGFMTTIHAVTDSQNLLDNSHKKSARLRRAAFASAIPSTTGSAVDIGKLYPELKGKIVCQAVRVPLYTVSMINLVVKLIKKADQNTILRAYRQASKKQLKGVIFVAEEELVSVDYVGSSYSSIIDPFFLKTLDKNMVNVYAWYDNEWGYASRLVDVIEYVSKIRGII